jgi:CBS domain containing-hemolysin-like protein
VESIIVIVACLIGSAFFSGSETALMRLREAEIEAEAETADGPSLHAIRELLRSTSHVLVTILIGNNVVNILGASVAAALAVATLGPELGVGVATVAMTLLVLLFSEILPKAVAAAHPRGVSTGIALPLYLFHQLLRPVHGLFDRAIEPLLQRVVGGSGAQAPISVEELLRLARSAQDRDAGPGPLPIIAGAAEAAERTAEEIMVHRAEVVAFPVETSPEDLLEAMLGERYTRVPIYEGSIDHVLGIVHFKDLVMHARAAGGDLRAILKPVLRVPERKPILAMLADMQSSFVHLAVVKDEHGVTQGIVTHEDILEEIVGEIRDEFDQEELRAIRRLNDDEFEALGRIKVLDFNRAAGWEIPSEPGDTLSGVVFNALGRSALKGDRVELPGYELRVTDVSGTRIARLRVRRLESAGRSSAGGSRD